MSPSGSPASERTEERSRSDRRSSPDPDRANSTVFDPLAPLLERPMAQRVDASWFISGLGLLLAGSFIAYLQTNQYFLSGPFWLLLIAIFVVGVLAAALIFGGYWLTYEGIPADDQWRITLWVLVGLVGTVALVFWPIYYQGVVGNAVRDPVFVLLTSSGIGLNTGLIIGVYDIRSRHQLTRAEEAQESLTFVNRLLRHDINNAVTVISGRAELLADADPVDERTVESIKDQCESIESLITDARKLSEIFTREPDLHPVDLGALLETQVSTFENVYDSAEIIVDSDVSETVKADSMLSSVVSNLIENAIVHNDTDRPRVDVWTEETGGTVRLHVADNGPGIDEAQRRQIFEPTKDSAHGMGMYLVKTLSNRYGGDVTIGSSACGGARITVELAVAS